MINVPLGTRFSRLTVSGAADPIRSTTCTRRRLECRCDCGAVVIVEVYNLRHGLTKSCGCFRVEKATEDSTTHGDSGSAEHAIWIKIKERCGNPNCKSYPDYGGRGVHLADEWRDDYAAFLAHVGRRPSLGHSIERIDNERGYEPGNVRWATRKEQNRNKRNSIYVNHAGERRLMIEVCQETGIEYNTVKRRIYRGWPESKLFTALKS